jgi:GNAT superfamily N-acetyltransferase
VAFYRDLVGLPVLEEFSASFGEDGVILGLPDPSRHLEILRDRSGDRAAIGHDEIVLYLEDAAAVQAATAGLRGAGVVADCEGPPYWRANGAVTYRDPDGRALVFAPWIYGRVPDPVDRPGDQEGSEEPADGSLGIEWYDGDPRALRPLFEEAEDSDLQLESYIGEGRILVARIGDEVVGHLQLVETHSDDEVELKSMAVIAERRGCGIGKRLVEHALTWSHETGYLRMAVATAAADLGNLRFYQRRGFRFSSIEPDAFDGDAGYEDINIDGIPLRDRVWFTQEL